MSHAKVNPFLWTKKVWQKEKALMKELQGWLKCCDVGASWPVFSLKQVQVNSQTASSMSYINPKWPPEGHKPTGQQPGALKGSKE